MCYKDENKKKQKFMFEQNLKFHLQFGLFSATREYEVGIVSNRKLECYDEFVTEFCIYRLSLSGNWVCLKEKSYSFFFIKRNKTL